MRCTLHARELDAHSASEHALQYMLHAAYISVIAVEQLYALNVGDNLITLYRQKPSLNCDIDLLDN